MVKDLRETVLKIFRGEEPSREDILEYLRVNLDRYSGQTLYRPGEWEDLKICQHIARFYVFKWYEKRFTELMEKGKLVEGASEDYIQL